MASWKFATDLRQMINQYGMTVEEAGEVMFPCGVNKDKPMRDVAELQLIWLASRTVGSRASSGFRRGVRAARLLLVDARLSSGRTAESPVAPRENDAKNVNMKCIQCGIEILIRRRLLDRRTKPKCLKCGGVLVDAIDLPIDEYVPKSFAIATLGVSKLALERGIRSGDIHSCKIKGRICVGMSSADGYFTKQKNNNDIDNLLIRFGGAKENVCSDCGKSFRNSAALTVHRNESHPKISS